MVLLKQYDSRGFVFYTNYESRKGKEIAENPYGSLLFYWDILERQVRIDGKIEKISKEESEAYFKTRPYASRIGAIASMQSEILPSRFTLMRKVAELIMKHPVKVPLPPYWGGYRLQPETIEFWQGRKSRLHDRFLYTKENSKWNVKRLYP
jgi:pyridoxamine 5'-phosphate oxidase